MKRNLVFLTSFLLMPLPTLCTETSAVVTPKTTLEASSDQATTAIPETAINQSLEQSIEPCQDPLEVEFSTNANLAAQQYFENIVMQFTAIVQDPENVQLYVSDLLANTMYLAIKLSENNEPMLVLDDQMKERIVALIARANGTKNILPTDKVHQFIDAHVDKNDDEELNVVLKSFANIVNGFFNIVCAPEDPNNVSVNLASMLGNVITIAGQATKSVKRSGNNRTVIDDYIASMDGKTKKRMVAIVVQRIALL